MQQKNVVRRLICDSQSKAIINIIDAFDWLSQMCLRTVFCVCDLCRQFLREIQLNNFFIHMFMQLYKFVWIYPNRCASLRNGSGLMELAQCGVDGTFVIGFIPPIPFHCVFLYLIERNLRDAQLALINRKILARSFVDHFY